MQFDDNLDEMAIQIINDIKKGKLNDYPDWNPPTTLTPEYIQYFWKEYSTEIWDWDQFLICLQKHFN